MMTHVPGGGGGGGGGGAGGGSGSASFTQSEIGRYEGFGAAEEAVEDATSNTLAPSPQAQSPANNTANAENPIAAAQQKAKAPQIPSLSWSDKRFTAGKIVHQIFTVKNVQPGAKATITVVECDANGQQKTIDTINMTLDQGAGQYQNAWKRSVKDAEADMKVDGSAGSSGPLEYKYRVSTSGALSKDSKTLLMPTTYEVIVKNDNGSKARPVANEEYLAKKDGQQIGKGITSEQGGIVFRCVDPSANYTVEILGHEITVSPKETA